MAEGGTSKCVLLSSPNWYCSLGSDCSAFGVYAFVAKKHVYLLDVNGDVPVFKGQFSEHTDRVSVVRFCPSELYGHLCASGADDKSVRLWDVETRVVVASHNAHQAKVTCICWSPIATDLILSGDEKGKIIAWSYNKNITYSTCPVQEYIFCVTASCVTEQQAAVGYKNGLIIILQVDEQGIKSTHRLRGHDSDIHSMAWCPVSLAHLELGPLQKKAVDSQGNLLVSGSRDQTIRLWDTFNGKLVSMWNLPKRSSQKWRDRHDWQSKDRLWLSVCWPYASPNKIVTSSYGGDLLLWDLGAANNKDQVQNFGQGHSRIVFNICSNIQGTKLFTTSMDRQVILWDLHTCCSICTIPTLGGFVYALAISPLDPGTLAVAVGDNMIRVWHTTSLVGPYDAMTLWQGIKSKVLMVRWHPHKEGLLAYGTDDGQVGIYNVLSKRPEVFVTYHKKTVYSVSWGPPCPAIDGADSITYHVYSCGGDGCVLEHRPGHAMQDAIDVNSLIKTTNEIKRKLVSRTDVSWNSDGTAMALGNDDGSIEVFIPPSLKNVCIITVHKKNITCLVWHHGYGAMTSEGEGSFNYWLASGSNESIVHVHDLSKVLAETSVSVVSKTVSHRQLVGHSGRITALSWSPHQADRLVSSSYDGTAQVWDVEKSQPLANFRSHVGRVMSVCWSFLDADVVYSGGEDGTARPWRITELHHTQPPVTDRHPSRGGSKSSKNKKRLKPKDTTEAEPPLASTDELQTGIPSSSQNLEAAASQSLQVGLTAGENRVEATSSGRQVAEPVAKEEPDKTDSVVVVPCRKDDVISPMETDWRARSPQELDVCHVMSADDNTIGTLGGTHYAPFHFAPKIKGDGAKKKKKVKSMFPLSAVADNKSKAAAQQECLALARYMNEPTSTPCPASSPGESNHVNLGFFADRRSAYRMLATEGRHHADTNNLDYQLQLEVWQGNLGRALEMAAKGRQLCDWLVALSPLAGHDVWLSTAEMFADQLAAQGAHQRAVLYYLACHKVYEAIDVYNKQAMYREAIALAKVRLSPTDPVLSDLYCSWARKLEVENAYEQAAKCYLAVHLPADAVRILSTRGDQSSLYTALQIALISGEHQLAASLAVRVLHLCLRTGNWAEAHDALDGCSGVDGHVLALCTHELLVKELVNEGTVEVDVFTETSPSKISTACDPWKRKALISKLVGPSSIEDPPEKTWFLIRVIEAWDRANVLTAERTVLESAVEQLTSYNKTNLDHNLSIKQILVRASYDIARGLLCGLLQDSLPCALAWLQTLESCTKNNYLDLVKFLCTRLLPRGADSLDNIILIGRELVPSSECAIHRTGALSEKVEASSCELYLYINAYYLMVVLYKIWWRDPEVLAIFSESATISQDPVSHKACNMEDAPDAVISSSQETVIEEGSLEGQSGMSRKEDDSATLNALPKDSCTPDSRKKVDLEQQTHSVQRGDDSVLQELVKENEDTFRENEVEQAQERAPKEPFSSSVVSSWDDVHSVMTTIRTALLCDSVAQRMALKKRLLEARKNVVLLRSRKILDSVAIGKGHVKRRPKAKKSEQPSQAVGESLEESGSGSVESEATSVEPVGDGEGGDMTSDMSVVAMDGGDDTNKKERMNAEDRGLPLEARYKEDVWTLERMEDEEQRILRELDKHKLKDLPFPDPVDAAMVMGYLCCHHKGLPVGEPAMLYQLGLEVSQWGLQHAQWALEITCLTRLVERCSKHLLV